MDLRFCWILRWIMVLNGSKEPPELASVYSWWKDELAEYLGPV